VVRSHRRAFSGASYYRLFKDILTAVLDGLRLLVTPFRQEEFNPTDDRKARIQFGA
jgi:hypothetical protein